MRLPCLNAVSSSDFLSQLIRENRPCNLYFDLEFSRDRNPHLELDAQKEQALVDAFVTICIAFMRQLLLVSCERDDVIDLDSSTAQKFSRHLIFRIPGRAWASNAECGRFVRRLAADLHVRQMEPMIAQFYVATEKPGRSLFVDMGVYTRNRNFRLMKSSKLGKGNGPCLLRPVILLALSCMLAAHADDRVTLSVREGAVLCA